MKTASSALILCFLLIIIPKHALCEVLDFAGYYKGKINYSFNCKQETREYDITVLDINPVQQQLSLRNYDYVKMITFVMKKCSYTQTGSDLNIKCNGNWGNSEYTLSNEQLKGTGTINNGKDIMTFTVKVQKSAETSPEGK
jgi:hypothetical protein